MIWLYSRWMSDTELAPQSSADPAPIPALGPPSYLPDTGWVVTRHDDVCAVLSDPRYEVGAAASTAPVGTISWLRASVSRFVNGDKHARRRAIAVRELQDLPPRALRGEAEQRALAVIDAAPAGGRLDVMASLARRVPMAVLAARLGIADAGRAAELVIIIAGGYFPGSDAQAERAADRATAELAALLGAGGEENIAETDQELIAAKIALMVQGCDATAGLIGKAVYSALRLSADGSTADGSTADGSTADGKGQGTSEWPTDAILAEVLRHDPPGRVSRRVSREAAELDGCAIAAGSSVLLRVDSANRDPAVYGAPEMFDPGRSDGVSLSFGYGLRPCPGADQAVMLAAGVVQAVRDRAIAVAGPVEYEPSLNIRVPARLEVILR
jgi:cytochrome P450